MKIFTLIAVLLFTSVSLQAQHTKKHTEEKAKSPHSNASVITCPVTGEEADPEISYAYEGKTYNFCCGGCLKKFKKEPTKYIQASAKNKFDDCDHQGTEHKSESKQSSKDGASLQSSPTPAPASAAAAVINNGVDLSAKIVNAKCPVMGDEVDKAVTTVTYNEKVYGFCCKGCVKKFAANPSKYLKNQN